VSLHHAVSLHAHAVFAETVDQQVLSKLRAGLRSWRREVKKMIYQGNSRFFGGLPGRWLFEIAPEI
jgi:hypothetical protein